MVPMGCGRVDPWFGETGSHSPVELSPHTDRVAQSLLGECALKNSTDP